MAKTQTRRSVSINGKVYEKAMQHCRERGLSMSQFVEMRICDMLNIQPPIVARMMDREEKYGPRRPPKSMEPMSAPPVIADGVSEYRRNLEKLAQREAAFDDPCRREGCPVEGLHRSHE